MLSFLPLLLLLFHLHLLLLPSASSLRAASPDPYETLQAHGLPSGLFPKGIANFSISDDGIFVASLNQSCTAKLDNAVKYNTSITGALSYGQIGSISGVAAQDLFLWFPVLGIRVDVPSSGVIYFDVGVVNKRLAVSSFDTPPDCSAETDGENSEDGSEISRVVSLSHKEKLREKVDQGSGESSAI
ncbi:hypothetical protein LUZ62_017849 [Rhynchospora pubera]|uniref:Uncharacterized protein n=1 Tax=Rhynchospora pubera TaxID=906938 RepID=A0AAV8GQK1_9POAL|nr:hypothetical protein LUZ62_017849 [Rhynchospora pubera]